MYYPSSRNAYRHGIQDESVIVYIRNYAKRAIMIKTEKYLKMDDLKAKIYKKMKVPVEDQVLFLQGSLISDNYIQLENKMIFHLINMKRVMVEKISLILKRIEPNSQIFKFTIPSTMLIDEFIEKKLEGFLDNVNDYFLVHSGRQLKPTKTFQEEFVEDNSEILCIHKVQNLKVEMRRIPTLDMKENFTGSGNNAEKLTEQNIQKQSNKSQGKVISQGNGSRLEKLKLHGNYVDILKEKNQKTKEKNAEQDINSNQKVEDIGSNSKKQQQEAPEKTYQISLYDVLTENYEGNSQKKKIISLTQKYSALQVKKQKQVEQPEMNYFEKQKVPLQSQKRSQEKEKNEDHSKKKSIFSNQYQKIMNQRTLHSQSVKQKDISHQNIEIAQTQQRPLDKQIPEKREQNTTCLENNQIPNLSEKIKQGVIERKKTQRSRQVLNIFNQRLQQQEGHEKCKLKRSRSRIIQVNIHHTISLEIDNNCEPEDHNIEIKSERQFESKQYIEIDSKQESKDQFKLQNQSQQEKLLEIGNKSEQGEKPLESQPQQLVLTKQKTSLSTQFSRIMNQRLHYQAPSLAMASQKYSSEEVIDLPRDKSRSSFSDQVQKIMSQRILFIPSSQDFLRQTVQPMKKKTNNSSQIVKIMNSRVTVNPSSQTDQFCQIIENDSLIKIVKCHSVISENGTKQIVQIREGNKQSLSELLKQNSFSLPSQFDDALKENQPKVQLKVSRKKITHIKHEQIQNGQVKNTFEEVRQENDDESK